MASKLLKVVLLVIVAGIILYVVRSGAVSTALRSIPSGSSASSSGFNFFQSNGNPPASQNNNTGTPAPSQTSQTTATPAINPADIPSGFTAAQLSPSFRRIRLGGVSYGTYYGAYGQISLYANLPASTDSTSSPQPTLDITGWQIKTQHSGETIPQAINVYDPSGLTAATDIWMQSGDTATLYTTPGPFNVRLNKCIGYIAYQNRNNATNPPLPSNCPGADRAQIQNFTGACQNYITSISSCQPPNLSDNRIPFNDYACRDYIANHFTYYTCYKEHVTDADFLSHQIWIWTGGNVVDQYHDQVQLLDKDGLLVDVYRY